MHYWSDEIAGVCVCKMSQEFDENHKTNLSHALDYICGKLARALQSRVPTKYQFCYDAQWMLRVLFEPYVKKHIKDTYTGIARCSSTDTFQYNIGQEIARARCLESFYSDLMEAIADIGNVFAMLDGVNYSSFVSAENSAVYWENILAQHQ